MQDFQQRVIDEKSELDNKIDKLATFVDSDKFETLSAKDRSLLYQQLNIMINYSAILGARIAGFEI